MENSPLQKGALKRKVLSSVSSRAVTYATGALNSAHGVLGMAGVEKTIALQGLASDKDVRSRFTDGIKYLSWVRQLVFRRLFKK